jgi:hypothetical protein
VTPYPKIFSSPPGKNSYLTVRTASFFLVFTLDTLTVRRYGSLVTTTIFRRIDMTTQELIEQYNKGTRDFSGANLSDADLRSANLRYADLRNANLRSADLRYANLSGANLSGADLSDANLAGADLSDANLAGADLRNADLSDANLGYANLGCADLRNANLGCADLRNADLRNAGLAGADLRDVKYNYATVGMDLICPEVGAFDAWAKKSGVLMRVRIPASAKRSSATTRKCRASKVKVLWMDSPHKIVAHNAYGQDTIYRVGEYTEADKWDDDRWNECSNGIHFFMTEKEAREW